MTCRQCKNLCECEDDAFVNGASFDPDCSTEYCTGFEPITNADRIRDMSDEELARYMAELIDNIDSQTCCYSNIPDEWLSWLQQPAEVE